MEEIKDVFTRVGEWELSPGDCWVSPRGCELRRVEVRNRVRQGRRTIRKDNRALGTCQETSDGRYGKERRCEREVRRGKMWFVTDRRDNLASWDLRP